MHLDEYVTPHKRHKLDTEVRRDKEDKDPEALHDWTKEWFQHYTSWSDQIGEEVDNLNTAIFKLRSRLGTSSTLDGEQLRT